MSERDDGGPAFPVFNTGHGKYVFPNGEEIHCGLAYPGMSLRDWLAGMAMVGFMFGVRWEAMSSKQRLHVETMVPARSYMMADRMLEARK